MASGDMTRAFIRQLSEHNKSVYVDRTGWTRQQWIEDARELMNHPDGAITSLCNGHVMALLEEVQEADKHDPRCESHSQHKAGTPCLWRERTCVWEWPDCKSGEYNPACCRFPKSCSVRNVEINVGGE